MQLFTLDRAFERTGLVTEYEGLVWNSNAWDHSKASLKCPPDHAIANAVFLERSDMSEAMKVTRRHLVREGSKSYLELEARGATIMLEKRANWGTRDFVGVNLATAVRTLLEVAVADQPGLDRAIPGLLALDDLTLSPYLITKQVSWGSVATAIYELVREAGFSFGMRYAPGGIQPFIRRGVDWSSAVVFSDEYGDIASVSLDLDDSEAANLAVIAGEGEGPARTVTTATVPDGDELAELFVDAKDLQSTCDEALGAVTATAGTDTFSRLAHGLANGNGVSFENTGGALPGGITDNTTYYIINATNDTFKVSLTPGGAAVDITSAGTGTHTVVLKLMTSSQYVAALQQRGRERIAELPITNAFEASVTEDRYVYRSDYALGDRVAYRAFGLEGTDVISEVTESFERGNRTIALALGKTQPTIRQLIR